MLHTSPEILAHAPFVVLLKVPAICNLRVVVIHAKHTCSIKSKQTIVLGREVILALFMHAVSNYAICEFGLVTGSHIWSPESEQCCVLLIRGTNYIFACFAENMLSQ